MNHTYTSDEGEEKFSIFSAVTFSGIPNPFEFCKPVVPGAPNSREVHGMADG